MEELLTPDEVSKITKLAVGALAQLRHRGEGPAYRRLSPRSIRYTRADVQAWIEASKRTRTDQLAAPARA